MREAIEYKVRENGPATKPAEVQSIIRLGGGRGELAPRQLGDQPCHAMRELLEDGLVRNGVITEQGLEALEPYRVKRAVFIAAYYNLMNNAIARMASVFERYEEVVVVGPMIFYPGGEIVRDSFIILR